MRLAIAILVLTCAASAQQGGPVLPYKLVEWPTPARSAAGTPAAWNFIQVASVATAPNGNVIVLHRGAHPILEFEPGGKFVRSWGDGLFSEGKVTAIAPADRAPGGSGYTAVYGPAGCTACGAHMVRVDGEANIWLVDACAHAVYKTDANGRVLLQLGTKGVAGGGPRHFNLPTDVGFGPGGEIYVSDGYGSARVVKFARDGKFLLEWGRRGTGAGEFGLPHNVVVDAGGRVYVSDRDNRRIQVFDSSGKYLKEWRDTGGVSALAITKDQRIWAGGVLRDLEGKALGRLPETGGHGGMAFTGSGDVFVGQLSGVAQKFVRQ